MATAQRRASDRRQGTAFLAKHARVIRWISLGIMLVAVLLLVRSLPLRSLQQYIADWIEGLGVMGPLVFGLLYVVATVLLIPGSVLTLAGGAVFGLGIGFVTVSAGSVTGAALAFLIARHLVRARVEEMARTRPKFAAVDEAISEGGWKIVALLRLSPAIPFNVQNYLYGLTDIKFWPYVIASWLAMAPGTFLYVYLGHVAGVAATGRGGRSAAEWVLLFVGLLATLAVTVYVTLLARNKLKEKTALDEADREQTVGDKSRPSSAWTIALASAALGLLAMSLVAQTQKQAIARFLGTLVGAAPPQVTLMEAYEPNPAGPTMDHSLWDAVLKEFVREGGWVDYASLKAHPEKLREYLDVLADAPFDKLGRNEKLALLINAYNAFTLQLIIENDPVESIKEIPSGKRWESKRWQVGGHTWSLSQIEHEQIRPKFAEPRIHFALVCAAVGCPPLAQEAYRAEQIEQQLQRQAEYVHDHETWFQYEPGSHSVALTKLYDWYGDDFAQVAGSVLQYAARFSPPLKEALKRDPVPQARYLEYDWRLNDLTNQQPQ